MNIQHSIYAKTFFLNQLIFYFEFYISAFKCVETNALYTYYSGYPKQMSQQPYAPTQLGHYSQPNGQYIPPQFPPQQNVYHILQN